MRHEMSWKEEIAVEKTRVSFRLKEMEMFVVGTFRGAAGTRTVNMSGSIESGLGTIELLMNPCSPKVSLLPMIRLSLKTLWAILFLIPLVSIQHI